MKCFKFECFHVFKGGKNAYLFWGAFCLLFICILVRPADAHKVNIFAYTENGRVYAEGYFADGSKSRNSLIEVIDNKTGEKLLEGNTDNNGQFSFDIPRATSLKLILYAGTGHQNEYTLPEEEVRETMLTEGKKTGNQAVERKKTVSEPKPLKQEEPPGSAHDMVRTDTSQDLDAAVERVIDKKLQPVMRILISLHEKSEKPGLTEILGGIGYIIGIVGIIAYFKGRSANRHSRS